MPPSESTCTDADPAALVGLASGRGAILPCGSWTSHRSLRPRERTPRALLGRLGAMRFPPSAGRADAVFGRGSPPPAAPPGAGASFTIDRETNGLSGLSRGLSLLLPSLKYTDLLCALLGLSPPYWSIAKRLLAFDGVTGR